MNLEKWVKSIQTAGYNGARTVIEKWMIKNEVKLLQYYVGDIFGKGHYLVD